MSRVQLALNVADIDSAVEFYSKLFGAEPAKRRPGYANFAILDPPLKLVLMENADARGSGVEGALNHLGVEVETPEEVAAASSRLIGEGLATDVQEGTTCCFAVQDKVWVRTRRRSRGRSTPSWPTLPPSPGLPGMGSCCAPRRDGIGGRRAAMGPLGRVVLLSRHRHDSCSPCGGVCWPSCWGAPSWLPSWSGRASPPSSSHLAMSGSSSWRTPQPPRPGCTPSS